LPWENEEGELEETHQEEQVRQEEVALSPLVQQQHNQLQQQLMSKLWAKIPLSSKEIEKRLTPS